MARLANGYANWAMTHGDFNLTLDANDPRAIMALIGRAADGARPTQEAPVGVGGAGAKGERSQFRAVAAGIANDGLATLVTFDAANTALSFRGSIGTNDQGLRIVGDVAARAANGQQVVQLLPGWEALDLTSIPIDGVARLDMTGNVTRLQRIALNIATTSVTGDVTITPVLAEGSAPRRRVVGRLDAGDMSAASMLALVSQRAAASKSAKPPATLTGAPAGTLSGKPLLWPEDAIDFSRLDGLEGVIDVTAGRLMLDERLGLDDVKFALAFGPKVIEVRALEGDSLGGRWSGSWRLDRIPGGGQLNGALRATGGRLDALFASAGRAGGATGIFNGVLTLSGRGTTVRTLVSSATGSGSLDLGEVQIGHLSPRGVVDAVEAAMAGPATAFGTTLRQKLLAGRDTLRMALSPRVLPFDVADGTLRLKPLILELVDGVVRPSLAIDLATLDLVSTWNIEARPRVFAGETRPAAAAAPLPVVSFLTNGRLGELATSTTRLDSETLERELAVRKMERDVLELERLRKLDEDRAREEVAKRAAATPADVGQPTNAPATSTPVANVPAIPAPTDGQPAFSTTVTPATAATPTAAQPPAEIKPLPPAPRPAARPRVDTKSNEPLNPEQLKRALGGG
jgi:hypothetical protein